MSSSSAPLSTAGSRPGWLAPTMRSDGRKTLSSLTWTAVVGGGGVAQPASAATASTGMWIRTHATLCRAPRRAYPTIRGGRRLESEFEGDGRAEEAGADVGVARTFDVDCPT